ncbi:MAG: hypothetical protein BGN88_02385 [Clostridiales bacterium 43-6]|nr:MAG: hypothetical protein BGN88_02385 [Clostridiales bacterium 43-6]
MQSFESLNLSYELHRATKDMGYETATEIQEKTLPIILEGKDVIGRSQTGTGKTAAFSIPMIELVDASNKRDVQALVVCPTRELAMQSHGEIKKLYKYKSGVKAAALYGGQHILQQIRELKKGINIVVGTPGRIMDHLRRGTLKLNNTKIIVLDEADEMLNMGFRDDIETILKETPETRQTVLFSATMPPEIMALTKQYQKDPVVVEINKHEMTITAIEQLYCEVPQQRKKDALIEILKQYTPHLAIVFCNTQKMVDELSEFLNQNGFDADGIHGNMRQHIRTKVMGNFKTGTSKILVATDVAARGIDAPNVEIVINYDIPTDPEFYIHRIGRTGRAGKSGRAVTILGNRAQLLQLKTVERMMKQKVALLNIEMGGFTERKATQPAERIRYEKVAVKPLRPERKEPRSSGTVSKIELNIGKEQRVAPNHIVGAIAEKTSLSGSDIGKIIIGRKSSTVEVPATHQKEVLSALKGGKIMGLFISARPYDEDFADTPFAFPKGTPKKVNKK